jgi:hypothetical protein
VVLATHAARGGNSRTPSLPRLSICVIRLICVICVIRVTRKPAAGRIQ